MLKLQTDAILEFVECMLIQELYEGILVKHVDDHDVKQACFAKVHDIIEEAREQCELYRQDNSVAYPIKKK